MDTSSGVPPGLGTFDLITVLLYLVVTFGIALVFSRQHGSTEEFYLGGRRMPWFAIGLSIIATLMSTISYLAVPGEMIKHGIGMLTMFLAIPFSMTVVLLLWVPFFMRLRLTSAYEYLEQRFSIEARLLAATLFVLMRLGWMGVVVFTSSKALARMLQGETVFNLLSGVLGTSDPMDPEGQARLLYLLIALVGIFATVYTAVGGMRAVVWTDVMQFFVLFSGTLVTLGYVIYATGTGPVTWFQQASEVTAHHTSPPLFSLDLTVRVTVFGAVLHSFFWTICTHGSDQVVLQRYFSTSSAKAARRSYVLNAVADVSVGLLLALCGLALLAFYLQNESLLPGDLAAALRNPTDPATGGKADDIFPFFIARQLPPGLGGLILAALIAAAMSSIDSGVNSVSAVISTDFFERFGGKEKGLVSDVALARLLTLFVGVAATAAAYGVTAISEGSNIMELMAKGFNLFLGPLAALFFIGMFLPRCTSRSALPSVFGGIAVAALWSYWAELFGTAAPTFTLAVAVPCVFTFAMAVILGWWIESGTDQRGWEYYWLAVMRRREPTDETVES